PLTLPAGHIYHFCGAFWPPFALLRPAFFTCGAYLPRLRGVLASFSSLRPALPARHNRKSYSDNFLVFCIFSPSSCPSDKKHPSLKELGQFLFVELFGNPLDKSIANKYFIELICIYNIILSYLFQGIIMDPYSIKMPQKHECICGTFHNPVIQTK
ncbi:MAG: hypothetical protein ACI4TB_11210, partial [Lachnospiraceae bacterium]